MKNRVVVVLTACVNPNGMPYTKIQDAEIRKLQYINALRFYLEQTNLPIVFVENTNTDISDEFKEFIHNGRLEYLTFEGNNFDKMRGKGYGEALILMHAIEHSKLVKQSKYIFKITGRVIVRNIVSLSKSKILLLNHVFRCNFFYDNDIVTVTYICRPNDLFYFLRLHLNEITEHPRGSWIERVFYKGFVSDRILPMYIIPFFESPFLEGVCGTSGVQYGSKTLRINVADNLYYLSKLIKERKEFCKYYFILILYYFVLLFNKLF